MTIRRASLDDLSLIAQLESEAGATNWSEESLRTTLLSAHTQAWMVSAPAGAGYLLARALAAEGEILNVCVHPSHRRQGLARSLLHTCLTTWTESGITAGYLDVSAQNHAAIQLYSTAGWRRFGVRQAYYADGEDAVQMRWSPDS